MSIEDVNYLKANSIKQTYTFLIKHYSYFGGNKTKYKSIIIQLIVKSMIYPFHL